MTTARQTRPRRTDAAPARGRKVQKPQKTVLRELYARLEKAQPGSAESKRISAQIVNAIG